MSDNKVNVIARVMSPDGQLFLLDFYRLEGLFKRIVNKAIEKDMMLKKDFEINYKDKISRLCPETLYAIYRLGWVIFDPLNQDFSVALVSDGENLYFASENLVLSKEFDREKLNKKDAVCPLLTDEALKYKESLVTSLNIEKGIVDEKGFVDCNIVDNVENLAAILLMFEMMHDKALFMDYKQNKNLYTSSYDFMISRENVVAVDKNVDGKYNIEYVSDNSGAVESFVTNITNHEMANNLPMSQGEMALKEVEEIELPAIKR